MGGGQIDVLKYLKSEGVAFDSLTCYSAALGGLMDVLKYLKSEGVAFDEETCRGAAEGGYLKVLIWLRSEEVNCPWNVQECLEAAENLKYNEKMVIWIVSRSWMSSHP